MKYKFGLVLSGGGTRGAYHIGVVKALQEKKIKPGIIAGCSAGALVGAFYANDIKADEIFSFMETTSMFSKPSFRINQPGFFDSEKYLSYLKPYFKKDDFSTLKTHLKIYSTDLCTGELVEHHKGSLTDCIMASCAIPGVFTPLSKNGRLLSDGGIVNVFPVSKIRQHCSKVLGVLITNPGLKKAQQIKHTHHLLERAITLAIHSASKAEIGLCDWLLDPVEIAQCNMISKKHIHDLYEMGYQQASQLLSQINSELN